MLSRISNQRSYIQTFYVEKSKHRNENPKENGPRLPRIGLFYIESEKIAENCKLLNPEIIRDDIIFSDTLMDIAKRTDCLIVSVQRVVNNWDVFKRCRGMFRYIELYSSNKDDPGIVLAYDALKYSKIKISAIS